MCFSVIFWGMSIFLVVMLVHVIVWRVFKPGQHIANLFLIFLIVPFVFVVVFAVLNIQFRIVRISDLLSIFLLYFSLACVYIQTYPAVYATAPSLKIVYLIKKSMPGGLRKEEIKNFFTSEDLLNDRIEDLIFENFVYIRDGEIRLKFKGKLLAGVFCAYRKLYGFQIGEG